MWGFPTSAIRCSSLGLGEGKTSCVRGLSDRIRAFMNYAFICLYMRITSTASKLSGFVE